jgi:hypothetical protein
MGIVQFKRPDNSPIIVVVGEIVSFAAVPTEGPMTGPLTTGTRIVFRNQTHQDVKEDSDTVGAMVSNALHTATASITGTAHAAAHSASVGPFASAALNSPYGGVMTNVGGHPDWPGRKKGVAEI